jgi:hypothetical protein
MKKRKVSWRTLKFIPAGGDPSQAVCPKNKGWMHLCRAFRDMDGFSGYSIHDTRGVLEKLGFNNVNIDWSDFRLAWVKATMEAPPEKPSVFCGEWFPSEHSVAMRRRLLAAAMREYISAQCLAEDVLVWLSHGREDDTRRFVISILHGVGWLREPPRTDQEASAKPIVKPEGRVPMIGPSA